METQHIGEMAELVSEKIFKVFGWEVVGPDNQNWPCVDNNNHKKKPPEPAKANKTIKAKSHPSDFVFRYHDPYSDTDVYLTSDLKSYAKDTVSTTDFQDVLRSLAFSVACANKSPIWAELYVDVTKNWTAHGLLFVYNHDGTYDGDFRARIAGIHGSVPVPRGKRLYILGPKDILYLNAIANDIRGQRGDYHLPPAENSSFYFAEHENAPVVSKKNGAATIETLLAPWQVIKYEFTNGVRKSNIAAGSGVYVYYRGDGKSIEDFQNLLDFLLKEELIQDQSPISIRMPLADENAAAIFSKAKKKFAEEFWPLSQTSQDAFLRRLENVTFSRISTVRENFSERDLGMQHG